MKERLIKIYNSFIFLALSWLIYVFWCGVQINEVYQHAATSEALGYSNHMLFITTFWGFLQYEVSCASIALFIASFTSRIFYNFFRIIPSLFIFGYYFMDSLANTISDAVGYDRGTFLTTILNSPQAFILVATIPLMYWSWHMWQIRRKRLFCFSFLTFLAFMTMNMIYHMGIIEGSMLSLVKDIEHKQEKLTKIYTTNPQEAIDICNLNEWACYDVERSNNGGHTTYNQLGEYKIYEKPMERLKGEFEKKGPEIGHIFGRNFSISQNDSPFLATLAYSETEEARKWFIVMDARFFQSYFIAADRFLSTMLLFGNLAWLTIILWVVKKHERFLAYRKKQ